MITLNNITKENMSENTKIEWADHTFNPWLGCAKVSPACDHCYAEGWAKRSGMVQWGPNADRRRTSEATWRQPIKWNAEAERLGIRYRVFCASLADVFDNEVPADWRVDLFDLIRKTPHLDWLLLTKRIGNARGMIEAYIAQADIGYSVPFAAWPWPNVWLGATICNQEEADRDIPKLLATPAAKRFLSMEPLLEPVDLRHLNKDREVNEVDCLQPDTWEEEIARWRDTGEDWEEEFEDHYGVDLSKGLSGPMHPGVNWVIVGGESGHNARPMHPNWATGLRDQCLATGIAFCFKQWGEWREPLVGEEFDTSMGRAAKPPAFILSQAGTVHCFESTNIVNGKTVIKVGKKAAGRLLDGQEWNGVPQ